MYKENKERRFIWIFKRILDRVTDILYSPFRFFLKLKIIKAVKHAALQPRNTAHVVFVCDRIHVRAMKMAYALKEVGWKVILLHKENFSFDVSGYFFQIRQFKNPQDALYIASEYNPVIYHVFSNYNFATAFTFIKCKPGKIVFDNYDVLTGMVKEDVAKRYKDQIELEQYCYVNADGLCCRDLRVQFLRKKLGYKLPPRILFSEYCWPTGKFKKESKLTDGIHIVYVGSIASDPESTEAYQYELAALLSKNMVHLHIYPSHNHIIPEMKASMKQFVKPGLIEKYIHIHETISPLNITQEISRYHYGLLISTNKVDFVDASETYFHHMGDYLLPSKSFDYLEAGLYTLTQNTKLIRFLLERYGNGKVVGSLEEIAEQCKHEPPNKISIPQSLLLESNIRRLSKFYSNLK